ncbi:LysE family translocator [Massilia horti]|nr:LysE family translocator [Massilia horti]
MAYVMASSLIGGRLAVFCAVAGIMAGGVCHMAMGALGVAVVLRLWPALFNAMLFAGAMYVAWIGWSLLRSSPAAGLNLRTTRRSPVMTFFQAMLTSLMNPKAYLFMLAVFPQFINPGNGPVWLQASALAVITAVTQAGVYGSLALVSSRAGAWIGGNPQKATVGARIVGTVLVLSAVLVTLQGWQMRP